MFTLQTEIKCSPTLPRCSAKGVTSHPSGNSWTTSSPSETSSDRSRAATKRMQQQARTENTLDQQSSDSPSLTPTDPNQHLVDVFKQFTRVMKDNSTSDTK